MQAVRGDIASEFVRMVIRQVIRADIRIASRSVARTVVRECVGICLIAVLPAVFSLVPVAQAQHVIEIGAPAQTASGEATIVAPGKVFTSVISFRNAGADSVSAILRGDFPPGWTPIVDLPSVSIGPGQATSRLVALQVPPSAPAGPAQVSFSVFDGRIQLSNVLHVMAEVVAKRTIVATELERPDATRTGSPVRHTYSIANTGNAVTSAVVTARSSAGYPVSIDPPRLQLSPGETGMVQIYIHPRADLTAPVTHRLVVDFAALDPAAGAAASTGSVLAPAAVRLSTPVELLPLNAPESRRAPNGLPVDVTLGASTEEGRTAGQIEAEIRPVTVGTLQLEAVVRTPDVRRASSFGQQDRYAAVIGAERGELRVGDHVWRSTDLLEIGQYGFGAGIEAYSGRWSGGAHAMRSRYLFPAREQYAAFGAYRPAERLEFQLHSIARRQYEGGLAASALAVARPVPTIRIEGELAAGSSDDPANTESDGGHLAWAVRATGSQGRSSWSTRFRRAGAQFPGSVRDTETLTAAANIFPAERLRLQFQGRRQTRHFEPFGGERVGQTTSFLRAGAGPVLKLGATGVSGTIHVAARNQSNGFSGLSRGERSLEAEAMIIHSRTAIRASLRRGRTDFPTPTASASPFTAGDVTVSGGLRLWSASVQAAITDGPTFFNPSDQQRLAGSVSLSREGRSIRAAATIFHSVDTHLDNRSFTTADFRLSRRFTHGVDVGLRARHVSASSARSLRDATIGIEMGVPLDIPVPQVDGPVLLSGRLVDAETGEGIAGVSLRLGSAGTETSESGDFSLRMPASVAWLNIDRPAIGLDRMPVSGFPMQIDPASYAADGPPGDAGSPDLEIRVVRSASLDIGIRTQDQESDRAVPAAEPMTAAERAGLLVEARLARVQEGLGANDIPRSSQIRRRLLGRASGIELSDLLPGEWVIRIVPETIPSGWESKPDSVVVTLVPGGSGSRSIALVPRRRTIRMVSSGRVQRIESPAPDTTAADTTAAERPDTASSDSTASDTTSATATQSPDPEAGTVAVWPMEYEIRPDDMLSTIAERVYGSPRKWVRIWLANRDRLSAPDDLDPGSLLLIPSGEPELTAEEMQVLQDAGRTGRR